MPELLRDLPPRESVLDCFEFFEFLELRLSSLEFPLATLAAPPVLVLGLGSLTRFPVAGRLPPPRFPAGLVAADIPVITSFINMAMERERGRIIVSQ